MTSHTDAKMRQHVTKKINMVAESLGLVLDSNFRENLFFEYQDWLVEQEETWEWDIKVLQYYEKQEKAKKDFQAIAHKMPKKDCNE